MHIHAYIYLYVISVTACDYVHFWRKADVGLTTASDPKRTISEPVWQARLSAPWLGSTRSTADEVLGAHWTTEIGPAALAPVIDNAGIA